jgi:hypothetical protein
MNRYGSLLVLSFALAASTAIAKGPVPDAPSSAIAMPRSSAQPDEGQLVEHGSYRNSNGATVHSPAHTTNGAAPVGASAKCRDSSYSFSQHHSGTCSGHGGVAEWL